MGLLLGVRRGQLAPSLLYPVTVSPLDVVAFDSFTDTDGTALTSHAADDGGTWSVGSFTTATPTIDGNRVHFGTASAAVYHSWVPGSADYDVSTEVVLVTDDDLSTGGPAARIDPDADTQYSLRYQTSVDAWRLFKRVAGVQAQLGVQSSQTLTVGQGYRATLSLRGSRIIALVDGVPVITVTDTAITAAGRAGLWLSNSGSSTTGVHLDTFRVRP